MLRHLLPNLVGFSRRHAALVLLLTALLTAASIWASVTRLGVDTDTGKLISSKLDWRKNGAALDKAFPDGIDQTIIVLDGKSPDTVLEATDKLAAALRQNTAMFKSVNTPDSGPYFAKNGLLFLSVDELTQLSNQLASAQPLLGPLAQDPSLRGLFGVLDKALTGFESGEAQGDLLGKPFESFASATETVVDGHAQPLDWGRLMSDQPPRPEELRHFIQVQARLDYSKVQPGSAASQTIRETAKALGLDGMGVRIRLTGGVPLEDDEFASVSEGAGFATTLSFVAVLVILFVGLRAPRMILAITLTLVVGLLVTAAFAALAVGTLNLISIAFAVLFIGIGVDFGIQFSMRYRAELFEVSSEQQAAGQGSDWAGLNAQALVRTSRAITGPLGIAALATCVGFFSFLPTDYKGVSELGLIAGTSMLIALVANLTVLPALLTIWPAHGRPESAGFDWARPIDDWLMRRAKTVLIIAGLIGVAALACIPLVRFDADPLDLRDPRMESVSTALELTNDPLTTPYTADLLEPNQAAAEKTAERLSTLPLVKHVITLASLVPEDQAPKLEILDQTKFLLGPILTDTSTLPKPSPEEDRKAVSQFDTHLHALLAGAKGAGLGKPGQEFAKALDGFLALPNNGDAIATLTDVLLSGLGPRLAMLRTAMQAGPVTIDTIPKEIRQDWIAADGRARLSIAPKENVHDPRALARFVDELRRNAPGVTGAPVTILESGRTVSRAFVTASMVAVIAITLVLALVLRSLRDVLLVLIPLLLAGLLALGTSVLLHLSFNYANVIAVPLLMGIGVAFDIYFVMAWRHQGGVTNPKAAELLQTATARAVVFSAFTTSSAFGSLILSPHRGMASMGQLLLMTLAYVLACTLIVQPALMKLWTDRAARR